MNYKLLRIYDIETDGNKVLSAKHEIIQEFDDFDVDDETERKLIEICNQKKVPYDNVYLVVLYKNGEPMAVDGNLFYHDPNNTDGLESFLDCAEWDFRVYASVALGKDLTIGQR